MKNYYIEYYNIHYGKNGFILPRVTKEELKEYIKAYTCTGENIIKTVQEIK